MILERTDCSKVPVGWVHQSPDCLRKALAQTGTDGERERERDEKFLLIGKKKVHTRGAAASLL